MKDMLKVLWAIVAIALVAPTTALDLQTLSGDVGTRVSAGEVYSRRQAREDRQQTTPAPPLQYDLCPGDTTTIQHQVYLPPAPLQADILFAFDTTGSMIDVIETTQENAVEIMANLQTLVGDIRFGVVDFRDYTYEPYGHPEDWPYHLRQPLTHHTLSVRMSIEGLEGEGGLDAPEAYTRALYEAYADERIGWRPEARRFIVMFGDSVAHDDDLNADVPAPQPHLPYEAWQTGYPPAHIDPGRDTQPGTDDDLDFQPVLSALRDHAITLLFIVSAARIEDLTIDELLVYWRTWAALTGPGGNASALEDIGSLPETIQLLVTTAVRHLDRLTVNVDPDEFDAWVTVAPPAYDDLDIPPNGLSREFEVVTAVPLGTPAGHYTFELVAEGDGTIYHRQQVEITVPGSCFATSTPTWEPPPTPKPHWMLYMPLIASDLIN